VETFVKIPIVICFRNVWPNVESHVDGQWNDGGPQFHLSSFGSNFKQPWIDMC
jgi:hypothetical protein